MQPAGRPARCCRELLVPALLGAVCGAHERARHTDVKCPRFPLLLVTCRQDAGHLLMEARFPPDYPTHPFLLRVRLTAHAFFLLPLLHTLCCQRAA